MKTITLNLPIFIKRFYLGLLLTTILPITAFSQDGSIKMTADDRAEFLGETGNPLEAQEVNRVLQNSVAPPSGGNMLKTNACPAAFIMNTPYNSNNGQRGCMFDVTATNTVTIRCFESNVYAGTTANYEIYYRAGTHVGNENNAGAWIFLGGVTGITSAGNNLPTALPIPINITIPAGQTYAFYITNDFGGGTSYTDGTAVGNFLAADANITVFEGVGKSYPFGLTFSVRNFNGHIFYDLGSVLDGEEAVLSGSAADNLTQLAWELPTNHQFQSLDLERSEDGLHYTSLTDLPLTQNGNWEENYEGVAKTLYYRLLMTDGEGIRTYSNTVELRMVAEEVFALHKVYPNPFTTGLNLGIEHRDGGLVEIQLIDQLGKTVYESELMVARGNHQFELELPSLPVGLYFLRCTSEGKTHAIQLAHQ